MPLEIRPCSNDKWRVYRNDRMLGEVEDEPAAIALANEKRLPSEMISSRRRFMKVEATKPPPPITTGPKRRRARKPKTT